MEFDVKGMVKQNLGLIDDLCDVLQRHDVSAVTGERILVYMAGINMGARGAPIADPEDSILLDVLAKAWTIGAAKGE